MNTNTRPAPKPTAPASFLATLRFSPAVPATKGSAKQREPRSVVFDSLKEQIAMAEAELAGKAFTVDKPRFVKNSDGKSEKTNVSVVPRRMYWQGDDGNWLVCVRYGGSVPVELSPGNPSIVAGPEMKDVLNVLKILADAVKSGEADQAIELAAQKMKRKPKVA